MKCQRCSSERILEATCKCSDMCSFTLAGKDGGDHNNGYVPEDMNIGGGDYLEFSVCLDCGQAQGQYPLPKTVFEVEEQERGSDPFQTGDFVEISGQEQLLFGVVEAYRREDEGEEVEVKIQGVWDIHTQKVSTKPMLIYPYRRENLLFGVMDVKKTDQEW